MDKVYAYNDQMVEKSGKKFEFIIVFMPSNKLKLVISSVADRGPES